MEVYFGEKSNFGLLCSVRGFAETNGAEISRDLGQPSHRRTVS